MVVQVQNEANLYQIPQRVAKLQLAHRPTASLSAKRHSPGDRDDNFGFGLIDPLQALQLADPRSATTTPPAPRPATRQR